MIVFTFVVSTIKVFFQEVKLYIYKMKSYFIIRYYFQILLKIHQRFSIYAFKKSINIPLCYFSTSLEYSLMLFICISYTVFLKHSMQFVPRERGGGGGTLRKQQEVYPKGFRLGNYLFVLLDMTILYVSVWMYFLLQVDSCYTTLQSDSIQY